MKRVNLRELYPDYYNLDIFAEVPDEVLAVILEDNRTEIAAQRQKYRYRAQYSLDAEDGIENATLRRPTDPEIILENHQQCEELHAAIMALPEKQAKRIYAKFYLGLTVKEIAELESVHTSSVYDSIQRGLHQLKKFL